MIPHTFLVLICLIAASYAGSVYVQPCNEVCWRPEDQRNACCKAHGYVKMEDGSCTREKAFCVEFNTDVKVPHGSIHVVPCDKVCNRPPDQRKECCRAHGYVNGLTNHGSCTADNHGKWKAICRL